MGPCMVVGGGTVSYERGNPVLVAVFKSVYKVPGIREFGIFVLGVWILGLGLGVWGLGLRSKGFEEEGFTQLNVSMNVVRYDCLLAEISDWYCHWLTSTLNPRPLNGNMPIIFVSIYPTSQRPQRHISRGLCKFLNQSHVQISLADRCRAKSAHIRQSRPDFDLDCQVKVPEMFQVVPSWLDSAAGPYGGTSLIRISPPPPRATIGT